MNIVFCHGVMGPEDNWETREYQQTRTWKEWLQFQVEKDHDVVMQIPRFPHAHASLMKYDEWEKIMNTQDITPDTTLIGHSAGGGFIVKYMAKHPELHVKQIILVAPWIDTEDFQPNGFYRDFNIDNDIVKQTSLGCDLLISDDDMFYILNSVNKITQHIPGIRVHKFSGRGHFVDTDLPELLQIIKF